MATTWVELESFLLGELGQRHTPYGLTDTWTLKTKETHKQQEQTHKYRERVHGGQREEVGGDE